MKKLKALIFAVTATICVSGFCGCNLLNTASNSRYPLSDYTSPTEVNAESLMNVRETIRSFNISIDTEYYISNGWFSRTAGEGLGSGVVFEEDENYYYALTNNHVITNVMDGRTYSVSYTVTDIYGTEYTNSSVNLIMSDEAQDIAILSFKKKTSVTYSLGVADYSARKDSNVALGEFVLAVGNPSGVNNIVTYGQVKGWAEIGNVSYSVINHNALINPGNSGGALCDIDGNLLGLNTWGTEGKDDENFSIPLSIINDYIDSFHSLYLQNVA
ncbi:MAG: trypsin-like peptidase domain-containing protein [Candidatus Coproplasma sp.]